MLVRNECADMGYGEIGNCVGVMRNRKLFRSS